MATRAIAKAPLILYSNKGCPWSQRATIALHEAGLEHSHVEINLQNKPEWYSTKINPAGLVPVLQVGGIDESSEEAHRVPESAIVLDLICDLAAERTSQVLSPVDPVERAEARYFIDRYVQTVEMPFTVSMLLNGDMSKLSELYKGLDEMQALLVKRQRDTGGPFWHGSKPGLADIGIAPFIGRLEIFSRTLEPVSVSPLHREVFESDKYAPFAAYAAAIKKRPSWKATFDEDYVIPATIERIGRFRSA